MSELQGIGRFKFHEGKLEEFKRLSAQAMEIVRAKDTGTLQYEIYFSDDQSECIVLERYRDRGAPRARREPWRTRGGNPCDGIGLQRAPW